MPGYGRRRTQNIGSLILLAIILVLWYLGKIPGLPPISTVLSQATSVETLAPSATQVGGLATPSALGSPALPASSQPLGRRSKTSGCVSSNALPDPACTPGAIFPTATREQICTSGYSSQVRNVTDAVKNQVYAEYGITTHEPGQYEVDHLISLELGGSNSIANLWPEPAAPSPGFHEKDAVENYLHDQVCSGAMSLQAAQLQIAHNWLAVYHSVPK